MAGKGKRKFHVVLFGATGFTGALTAQYFARHGGERLRWALAGRNVEKLEKVRSQLAELNSSCAELPILPADSNDAFSLKDMASQTRVVVSTVGPFIKHGLPVAGACAAAGTDYVDITGEPEFVDRVWLTYHEQAVSTGARIVNCCGFDSIPHDLGALFTVQQLPDDQPIKVEGYVRAGGEISGGTWHSAVNAFTRLRQTVNVSRERRALDQPPMNRKVSSATQLPRYNRELGAWLLPFPGVDPQVVLRSAAASEQYGPNFSYGHYLQLKKFSSVVGLTSGAGAAVVGAQFKLTRNQLLKWKSPGKGPSAEKRAKAWFKVSFVGKAGKRRVRTEVSGGDPGYGETAKMLAESALCLALDRLPNKAGVITPATAMGNKLIERLQSAGIQFRVTEAN